MYAVFFLALEDDESKNNDGISFSSSTGPAWAGSERDYTYDEVGYTQAESVLSKVSFRLFFFLHL